MNYRKRPAGAGRSAKERSGAGACEPDARTMNQPLPRIVVVGCGQWGRNHVRTLREIGALAGVADRSPERAAALAQEFGVPALSPEAAIGGGAAEALVLALPAQAHGPAARAALAAGKDVLVE
jgi:predicted dehydrogenase